MCCNMQLQPCCMRWQVEAQATGYPRNIIDLTTVDELLVIDLTDEQDLAVEDVVAAGQETARAALQALNLAVWDSDRAFREELPHEHPG